jgi:toxin CptA
VAGRRHSFSVSASFDQRLSLVVLACVCFSSFLAWPGFESLSYQLVKYGLLGLMLIFFGHRLWQLQGWRCSFMLDEQGEGILGGANRFQLNPNPWVTPFACVFCVSLCDESLAKTGRKRSLIIFRDMLDDTSYRHLCRLLLNAG